MLQLKLPGILICLLLSLTSTARSGDNLAQPRKLIEWGWDEPDTKFMRANIRQMEQFPFDGLVSKTEEVVVTGASAGVGRATVQAFARRGASIGLLARSCRKW